MKLTSECRLRGSGLPESGCCCSECWCCWLLSENAGGGLLKKTSRLTETGRTEGGLTESRLLLILPKGRSEFWCSEHFFLKFCCDHNTRKRISMHDEIKIYPSKHITKLFLVYTQTINAAKKVIAH